MIRRSNNRYQNRGSNETRGYYQGLYERYTKAAKENRLAGDVVLAEYNLQYAEHYMRLINEKFSVQQNCVARDVSQTVDVPQIAEFVAAPQETEEIAHSQVEKKPIKRKVRGAIKEQDSQ
jgi:hypothetical protein